MAEMTKKALNKIKAAAFTEFKQGFSEEEFRNLFAGGKNVVTAWRITEGTKSKIVITQYDTQPAVDTVAELQKYKMLLDTGVITEEEFAAKKKQLLGI